MKKSFRMAAAVAAFGLALAFFACSNSSGGNPYVATTGAGGQDSNPTSTPTPTTTPTQEPAQSATYPVTIPTTFENGTIAADIENPKAGQTVTLTATPANGYKIGALTVKGADGSTITTSGEGNIRTFTMPAQNVTVTATFVEIPAASGAYTNAGTTTISGISYDLVTFGLWPQTVKADGVTVNDSKTKTAGEFTYCKGSDGEWYAKLSDKYYKVEPIKWRVLTTNYGGKRLLLAESVLVAKRYDASSNNYQNSEIRKWLNGNANSDAASDYSGSGGFLKTAFTAAEQSAIAPASVDNSARSTNPDDNATIWNSGANPYASDTPTTDKIFLLSEQEATTSAYGFDVYNASGAGNKRIRVTTDYAKASGAYQNTESGMGGWWWLRSPVYDDGGYACYVYSGGLAGGSFQVSNSDGGVVPALCVSN